jgi:hypothetical protein
MKNSVSHNKGYLMESNWQTLVIFLLGVLQAWFFWDKKRDAEEIKVLRASINETKASIQRMEIVLNNLASQLAVANYALFKERKGESDDK